VYTYVLTRALLICDHCGHTRPVSGYVGLLAISNYHLFYDNGDFLKEWQFSGNKAYYMDENTGVAYDGVQEINGYTYVFKDYVLVEGAWIEENGTRKLMWAGELLTNSWHTQAGVTYYFLSDGTMATGTVEISSVNDLGETVVETYIFDENGALIGKQE
jgi:glucan-binding YG repeat protein